MRDVSRDVRETQECLDASGEIASGRWSGDARCEM
jgi:hypothetical protein